MIEQGKLESAIHHHLALGLIDGSFAPNIRTQNAIPAGAVRGPDVFGGRYRNERGLNCRVSSGCKNHARHEKPMRRGIFLAQGAIIYLALAGLP